MTKCKFNYQNVRSGRLIEHNVNTTLRRANMDSLDSDILRLLHANARAPVAALAHRLKVSRGTITNHIRQLEQSGVIAGYTAVLRDNQRGPKQVHAWMAIAVDSDGANAVVATLLGFSFVIALYDTNGQWDLLAELEAPTLLDLSRDLEHIRTTRGIRTSETSIHLATFRPPPWQDA